MLCKECREQIGVGEACVSDPANGRVNYYHVGCHANVKERGDRMNGAVAHYQQLAEDAKNYRKEVI